MAGEIRDGPAALQWPGTATTETTEQVRPTLCLSGSVGGGIEILLQIK